MITPKDHNWNSITKKEMINLFYERMLSDSMIAEMYGVTKSKVTYKRTKVFNLKWGSGEEWDKFRKEMVTDKAQSLKRFLKNFSKITKQLDPICIDILSKALAVYVFRNGPIENIHADSDGGSRITQKEMKILNKFTVNRIGGVLQALKDERIDDVIKVLDYSARCTYGWDMVEPYMEDFDIVSKCNIIL